jgi:ABC-type tungstate transport system permease subunit
MAAPKWIIFLLIALAVALLAPAGARADSASSLEVIGSSEPIEAELIRNVIQPAFAAAFPQFTFNYTGASPKTALSNAEQGTGGPSVLLLDSPALESPFVAGGFSDNGQPGNAVFTEDFVLAGTTGDPAEVATKAPHDIARAFADVAAAGVAGTAVFISRGGTVTAPFSTLAEHRIWSLVESSGLTPAGVVLCAVSEADGGGMTPIDPGVQASSGMPCPEGGSVSSDAPNWFEVNSDTETKKVTDTNACVPTSNGATHCYALTDHGTFDFLASAAAPASEVPNLTILARDNAASAPGGPEALLEYFHAYVINPAKPEETVNLQAAQDFLGVLTSPALQSRISSYLAEPGGGPFHATASPSVSASPSSASASAGQTLSVTGSLLNPEPGFPTLAGQPVMLERVTSTGPQALVSGLTNAAGQYTLAFTPPVSGSYEIATPPISQLEIVGLQPPFSDLLAPSVSAPFSETVNGAVALTKLSATKGKISLSGSVGPAAPDADAELVLLARPAASKGAFAPVAKQTLAAGQTAFTFGAALHAGAWTVEVSYQDGGLFTPAVSSAKTIDVPAAIGVAFKRVKIRGSSLTVSGALSSAPKSRGSTVRLLARKGARLADAGKAAAAHPKSHTFRLLAKVPVKRGHKTFSVSRKLARGFHYSLRLEYVLGGKVAARSAIRNITVR